ncbi:MAG: PilZ domain-containing protein [Gracilibacteraceae bacterium]|jgi:hypothetical protein|nr:PilZ domain-containing protein [Gracilibacteraceae bacterium]
MEIYRKAEVFTGGEKPSLLAVSLWCTVQSDENMKPQLILKDFNTTSLTLHRPVNVLLYSELGIYEAAAILTFIVPGTQANFFITRWSGRIERRSNLKVRVDFSGQITSYEDKDKNWVDFGKSINVDMKNISAGGVMFASKHEFNNGMRGSLTVPVVPFPLFFTVLRRDPGEEGLINYGCRLDSLVPHADALLCSYIYQRQVQLKVKQLREDDER